VGVSVDAEPVVDLGVVPFAQESAVVQRGGPVVGVPFENVVDVAPVVRGRAAGEDAGDVADLDRPA
jgi:hypothetical protein